MSRFLVDLGISQAEVAVVVGQGQTVGTFFSWDKRVGIPESAQRISTWDNGKMLPHHQILMFGAAFSSHIHALGVMPKHWDGDAARSQRWHKGFGSFPLGFWQGRGCFPYISAPRIAGRRESGAVNRPCRHLPPQPGGNERSGSSIPAGSCTASRRLGIEPGRIRAEPGRERHSHRSRSIRHPLVPSPGFERRELLPFSPQKHLEGINIHLGIP